MPHSKPNILVLMTDQQRWDAMGCAGNRAIRTPNMDALATSGVRFRNAVTPTPICVAARMSFITGHRAGRTRQPDNSALPGPLLELPTMMSLLLREGYWTQGVGKMHFEGRHYGFRHLLTMEELVEHRVDDDYLRYLQAQGVRTRFPKGMRDLLFFQPQTCGIPREHATNTWVADRSIEFLREHRRYRGDQPFFLWSSWISPHPPFAPCEPYDEIYDPEEMALPVYADRPIQTLPPGLLGNRARLDGAHHDPERMRRLRALYYGLVTHVDDSIGRILEAVETLGLAENTAVLFVSDHGEMLGDHGLAQKMCPYEASARIPFLLRWPGKTEVGRVCDDPVGLTDVMPTLIEELGLDYPEDQGPLTGENLLGMEGGGLASGRDAFVIDYGAGPRRWISIRTRTQKYAFFAQGGVEELYDLEADPHERHNLIEERPEQASHYREQALEWERSHGMPGSLDRDGFRVFPGPDRVPTEEACRSVVINEGLWPNRLPEDEVDRVESFAEAFTRAIQKEITLAPEKLSLMQYKEKLGQVADRSGDSLEGTPWEEGWKGG